MSSVDLRYLIVNAVDHVPTANEMYTSSLVWSMKTDTQPESSESVTTLVFAVMVGAAMELRSSSHVFRSAVAALVSLHAANSTLPSERRVEASMHLTVES